MLELLPELRPDRGGPAPDGGLIVDSFAGGGGASTGIYLATGRHPDIAVNHDHAAIAMHRANHPTTHHVSKNIYKVDPIDVCRNRHVGLLWSSPDCKHFSRAKGGKPVERNIRDLAWTIVSWAERVRPQVIIMENVKEFLTWGPVILQDGKYLPCKDRAGETFKKFVNKLRSRGYSVQYKVIRACDYGAPTIRERLYLIARCDGEPIVWPEPTHGPADDIDVIAGRKKPYRIAADCIDFSIPCPSIFDTSEEIKEKFGVRAIRPLAPSTLKRIAKGVRRYVLDNPAPFIVSVAHGCSGGRREYSIREPMGTQTGSRGSHAIVAPVISYAQQGGGNRPIDKPMHTVTASGKDQNCVIAPFLKRDFGRSVGQSVDAPAPTITAGGDGKTGVVAAFLAQHNAGPRPGAQAHDISKPISTITASGSQQAIVAAHIVKHNSGSIGSSLNEPAPTITANGAGKREGGAAPIGLASIHMASMRGSDRRDYPADTPTHTLSAGGNHEAVVAGFLDTYYGTDQALSLADPLGADTTRDRRSLVTVSIDGTTYVVVDIGMRMLTPRERFNAQGFPRDHIIDYGINEHGEKIKLTKSQQGRMCGNSVCPDVAEALVGANCSHLTQARGPVAERYA